MVSKVFQLEACGLQFTIDKLHLGSSVMPPLRSLRMHRPVCVPVQYPEERVCAKWVEVEVGGRKGLSACEFQGV